MHYDAFVLVALTCLATYSHYELTFVRKYVILIWSWSCKRTDDVSTTSKWMKPLFPIHPHPNDPKTKKLFILLSPLYPYHAYCLCSPQTGAKIIADIQLGSSLMIIESAKSDNKGEERGKTAMHCSLHCSLMCCTVWWTLLHCKCTALQCTEPYCNVFCWNALKCTAAHKR